MDKFREPEQFDAEVEIHGGEPFAVWAPAPNGSHVKTEKYYALLAELETERTSREQWQQNCQRTEARLHEVATACATAEQHIAELGHKNSQLRKELHNEGAANAHAYGRIRELEREVSDWQRRAEHFEGRFNDAFAKLATPVRLPPIQHREFLGLKIDSMDAEQVRIALRAAGFTFTVEGDEQ
ncbi:Uncharacterised protein [Serratia ficaria]|uniref:hypothetical protein n=1 Tax=Serratia ficaria TaxID=61651 RepID=UPI0021783B3C|nr:hypothetical protein [Serratia ficaria]CAI1103989.1 Uncharacterised protein [Serratia ficaria]CAI1941253.1 Uncharacterised protein [Serratia ficaria]CAI2465508.1 Uncharacterised protein [Serratia ficaria]